MSHGQVQADGAGLARGDAEDAVGRLLDALDAVDADGWYPAIDVVRPWSQHNPRVRREHPGGLPSHDIRSADEPLFEVDGAN